MKTGKSLEELAREVTRQADAKKDLIADTRNMELRMAQKDPETFYEGGPSVRMTLKGRESFDVGLLPHAERQIATHYKVPKNYYELLREQQPEMFVEHMNEWLQRKPATRMIRTLDNDARAFLSNRYRTLDNDELLAATLPVLSELGVEVKSTEVTDQRLYIKFITNQNAELSVPRDGRKVGDVVYSGGVITNSEVGLGSLSIMDYDWWLACLNGMVSGKVLKQKHVGRVTGIDGIDAQEYFRDDTRKADDRALMLKIRDTLKGMFSDQRFRERINAYNRSMDMVVEKPVETIEVVQKRFNFTDKTKNAVLEHFIKGGSLNAYGIANAVTRAAQDVESYDDSTEMEQIGRKVIDLRDDEWRVIRKQAEVLAA